MKTVLLTICIALSVPFFSFAQNDLLSKMQKFAGKSDSLGVWKAKNNYMIEGEGSIMRNDNTIENGTVQFRVSDSIHTLTYILFTPDNEMKPRRVYADDILAFMVKGKAFVSIRLKEDDLKIGHNTVFMEMLNDSPTDKFRMYQFRRLTATPSMAGANKPFELERGYYVMLPDFKNAHEIVDMTFTPFAKKMSKYLADCPELAKKIENKEKGYKYDMFKGAENDEVFFRIMQEYNNCGKQ